MSVINYAEIRSDLRSYYIHEYLARLCPGKYEKFSVQKLKSGEYVFCGKEDFPYIVCLEMHDQHQTFFVGYYSVPGMLNGIYSNDIPAAMRVATTQEDEGTLLEILRKEINRQTSNKEYILNLGGEMLKSIVAEEQCNK